MNMIIHNMASGPGILMRGKRGGIIYYVRNERQCMRIAPVEVSNPRTIKQMQGRKCFGESSKFASKVLKDLIHPYWNVVAKKIQRIGYNYFVTTNLPAFRNGTLTPQKLILIPENGLIQENFQIEIKENTISLSWKSRPDAKSARDEDEMYILIFSSKQDLIIKAGIAKRQDLQATIVYLNGDYHYYVFWKRENLWSESKFIF